MLVCSEESIVSGRQRVCSEEEKTISGPEVIDSGKGLERVPRRMYTLHVSSSPAPIVKILH